MRAVVIREFGDPEKAYLLDVPDPRPAVGEALVKVLAAGINPSDLKNIEGSMAATTLPRIPGRDFAGVVTKGPRELEGRIVWGTGGDIGFTRDACARVLSMERAAEAYGAAKKGGGRYCLVPT